MDVKRTLATTMFASAISTMAVAAPSPAEDVSGAFQWVGTVPISAPGTNWKIINTGSVDHQGGSLSFQEGTTANHYELVDSSELKFNVIDTANSDTVAGTYDYSLTSLRFATSGGFMQDVDTVTPEFALTADGSQLSLGSTVNHTTSADVTLQVVTPSETNAVSAGDEVVIQAVILINNQT